MVISSKLNRLTTLPILGIGAAIIIVGMFLQQGGVTPLTASAESQKSFSLQAGETRSLYLSSLPIQISATLATSSIPNEGKPWRISLLRRNNKGQEEGYKIWYSSGSEPSWYVGKLYPEGDLEENFFTHTVLTNPLDATIPHAFSAIIYPCNALQSLVHITLDGAVIASFVDAVPVDARFTLQMEALQENLEVTKLLTERLIKPQEPRLDTVLFFGDSITYGPALHRDTESMPAQINEFFRGEIQVINAGYPAEMTDDSFSDRHHEGLTRFIALLEVLRPEHVVITEGTNNITDPGLAEDVEAMVKASINLLVRPLLATLPPLYDGRSVSAANHAYRRIAERYKIPLVDFDEAFTSKKLFNQDIKTGNIVQSPRQLISPDGVHPALEAYHKMARITERVLRNAFSQHYLAEWVGQEVLKGERDTEGVITVPRGKTAEVVVRFRNRGTRPWFAEGERKVGMYVYRDEKWSTPREYNNITSPLFGTDFYADDSWGSNATNTREFARPALVSPEVVSPGEVGNFSFSLRAEPNAPLHRLTDSLATEYDDRYDRSDFSLAAGQEWMKNPFNGDPFGIAHVWFWIKVA